MCIRDSPYLEQGGRETFTTNDTWFTQGVNLTPLKGLLINCLLYTSDAADERSSVDLGGRRIIKKKNRYKRPVGVTPLMTTPTSTYIQN